MILERGKPYPIAMPAHDSASAHFLVKGGSVLALRLNPLSADDERVLRNGIIKAGLMVQGPALLFLFQFLDKDGPAMTFDAPFDARLIPKDRLELPDAGAESRLLIQVHGVDENNILRCLRGVTLPRVLTSRFLSAVMDQLASVKSDQLQHALWAAQDPRELANATTMEVCGR